MTKQNKISFVLNLLIFLFVLPCVILSFTHIKNVGGGVAIIKYFTVQSNILAGIAGLLFVIYYILIKRGKKHAVPKYVYVLKFVATVDLLLTFFTVLLFLAPTVSTGFFSLYIRTNFFFHFIVPILAFVSFIFFESEWLFSFKITLIGMIHMLCYTVFYTSVALSHLGAEGKPDVIYDWYGFAQHGVVGMVLSVIITIVATYLFCLLLWFLNNKMHNKKSASR